MYQHFVLVKHPEQKQIGKIKKNKSEGLLYSFQSPSLSVSVLHVQTDRLESVLWCWEEGVRWRKKKKKKKFPSNALQLK